tara:strand:+ start:18364 stop:18975 length:612 start_codon:yes stop_codon:yes gene_type:complete
MTFKIFLAILLSAFFAEAQNSDSTFLASNFNFRIELNHEFGDSLDSPLKEEDRLQFDHLNFFSLNSKYAVMAKIERIDTAKAFAMATTTGRKAIYQKYALLRFQLDGQEQQLFVYQSHRLKLMEGYEDYLFLPFSDESNGFESYGGGRFIDLRMVKSDSLLIDFNKAYNPYCAYNEKYSCPIPPKENHLKIKVLAGVKAPVGH